MAYMRKPRPAMPFAPVLMFQPETEADKWADKMVHSLITDIADTMNTERARKQEIGISEIGNPCSKCVARKLSGLYLKPREDRMKSGWKAQVGTFIHTGLEQHFAALYPHPGEDVTYHLERRVTVLEHKEHTIDGSCDMYVQGATNGVVVDWKTQNSERLATKTGKGEIGPTYTVQMMTYGLGYELLGFPVTHVLLFALPRDGELNDAKPVLMRYDRQVAVNALARLTGMIDAAELLEQAYPDQGWEKLIAAQDTASGCFDCRGYQNAEEESFLGFITGNK